MRDEGLGVLYRGIGIKTLHSVSQSFVYFYAFAYLRRTWEARGPGPWRCGRRCSAAAGKKPRCM